MNNVHNNMNIIICQYFMINLTCRFPATFRNTPNTIQSKCSEQIDDKKKYSYRVTILIVHIAVWVYDRMQRWSGGVSTRILYCVYIMIYIYTQYCV